MRLLAEAWRRLAWTRLALTVLPWRLASRLLSVRPAPRTLPADEPLTWAVLAASRFVPRTTCLCQALALQALLARRGSVAVLNFGVRTPNTESFEAHAWLELDGVILLGDAVRRAYVPLPRQPGNR